MIEKITTDRSMESSVPEDVFVDIFTEVFGIGKIQYLMYEYPFLDIYGMGRYIDYAVQTSSLKYAFEIDGIYYHSNPDQFESDLVKQNSLISKNWRVYRWTDRQIKNREIVKEELITFLGQDPNFQVADDYLPLQKGKVIYLKHHQEETLEYLANLRKENGSIALIPHATGSGKTITAILDAKRMNLSTLYVAHRSDLVRQTSKEFEKYWSEVRIGHFAAKNKDIESFVLTATIQSIEKHLDLFSPERFGYIIIDEAHHATAGTYLNLIKYFRPKFILGLTGTDERHDGKSLLEVFRNNAPRLTLEDAIKRGELCPIRCVRVKTNIDLKKVRYNGVNYNIKDLESKLFIPERDELIVNNYLEHTPEKKAVVFCVSIKHAEFIAELFKNAGIPAKAVSGRINAKKREATLSNFKNGTIRVLCACDILNEGWDCPDIEVLMMARPTLSKVIYLQQLGRGTRKAEGKESLLVFDFVDNTSIFNKSLNLHRLFHKKQYIPGALVLAPDEEIEKEKDMLARGEKPDVIVHLHLWVKDMEAVDLFNWQEEIRNMLTCNQLAIELGIAYETVLNWVNNKKIIPDYEVPMGLRSYPFFKKERVEEIRRDFKLPKRTADTIKTDFFEFIEKMDMTTSYKPVLLLGMIKLADDKGKVRVEDLKEYFKGFYIMRKREGKTVEISRSTLNHIDELPELDIQRIIFQYPFEKFERRRFFRREKDLDMVGFTPSLWRKLDKKDEERIIDIAKGNIERYYDRININRKK